jgi:hypothetical protein
MKTSLTIIKTILLLIFSMSTILAQAPRYEVTDLGTLPSLERSVATGINDSGDVVGYANTGGSLAKAFLCRM